MMIIMACVLKSDISTGCYFLCVAHPNYIHRSNKVRIHTLWGPIKYIIYLHYLYVERNCCNQIKINLA